MKQFTYYSFILFFSICLTPFVKGQTPNDAIMMPKGYLCIAALYSESSWDEYWEGTLKRDNGNIGTLTRQSFMPMIALGISDRINILAALPWVSTEPSGGQLKGVDGIQDFSLWIKAKAVESALGSGVFTFHPVVGVSLPASDYAADYVPLSIGLGAPELSLRGILQYKLDMGLYLKGHAAYLLRGSATIERDYYYTTHGIYSDEVDVPNAVNWGAALGAWLLNNTLQIEAIYTGLNTLDGFDIRRQDMGFPSNKMIYTQAGAYLHYHLPFLPGFGIVGEYGKVLTGRNYGDATSYTAGITYQFPVWGNEPVTTVE